MAANPLKLFKLPFPTIWHRQPLISLWITWFKYTSFQPPLAITNRQVSEWTSVLYLGKYNIVFHGLQKEWLLVWNSNWPLGYLQGHREHVFYYCRKLEIIFGTKSSANWCSRAGYITVVHCSIVVRPIWLRIYKLSSTIKFFRYIIIIIY